MTTKGSSARGRTAELVRNGPRGETEDERSRKEMGRMGIRAGRNEERVWPEADLEVSEHLHCCGFEVELQERRARAKREEKGALKQGPYLNR